MQRGSFSATDNGRNESDQASGVVTSLGTRPNKPLSRHASTPVMNRKQSRPPSAQSLHNSPEVEDFDGLQNGHASSSPNKRQNGSRPAPQQPIEEGDFVWVNDMDIMCTPAEVVRAGFLYDAVTGKEQAVTVVHTEDGEERELRDTHVIKLPWPHHPKSLPPSELNDFASIPLEQRTRNNVETFTDEQLEQLVLHTLCARFRTEQIYTWADRVLISVNPVQPLPIYTPEHMQAYYRKKDASELAEAPHVFAVAQNAIRAMQEGGEDQAIIVQGTMGSGKSEAAKLMVQHLCEVGEGGNVDTESETTALQPIGQQVLHAFTVLEAFGNAATPQNANSSRFAKMVSVEFSRQGHVIGGGFTNHYFERTRVISPRDGERNFHVFYQVLTGMQHDPALRDALDLNRSPADFELLRKGMTLPTDSAEDASSYRDLMSSFSALRIRKNQRIEIIRIVAALLHLGNVDFVVDPDGNADNEGASSSSPGCKLKDRNQLVLAAKLLDVEPVVLDNYFRTRQFFSKDKSMSSLKIVTVQQARRARSTFIRSVYESLFSFLVETMNGILGGIFDKYEKSNLVADSQGIHVLDPIGMEQLENAPSGFDQLCSNYWSEKLRSFYMQSTFAASFSGLEDEPQHVENKLTAHSNSGLLEEQNQRLSLFEEAPFGLFPLLNEHSKVRSPSDEDLVAKIIAGNDGLPWLTRPNIDATASEQFLGNAKEYRLLFTVRHYGGEVMYSGKSFSERNTMSISSTCGAIMQSSKNAVLHAVGAAQVAAAKDTSGNKRAPGLGKHEPSGEAKPSGGKPPSTSTQVMDQAGALLHALEHTGKHFVMCIKPSEDLEQDHIDAELVHAQIQDAQLVELCKSSKAIFTVHLSCTQFFRRYRRICGNRSSLQSLVSALQTVGLLLDDQHVVGKLKVYLTSRQHRLLEKQRNEFLNDRAELLQHNLVKSIYKRKYARLLYVLRELREAMKERQVTYIVQHVSDCEQILGKEMASDIRVVQAAKDMTSSNDDEAYVNSIADDALLSGHEAVLAYALTQADKYCPSASSARRVKVELDKCREKMEVDQKTRTRKQSAGVLNSKLRQFILAGDVEGLMGTLAEVQDPSDDSLERKLATQTVIRAMEEKGAVEGLVGATRNMDPEELDVSTVLQTYLPLATKVVGLGVEDRCSEFLKWLSSWATLQDDEVETAPRLVAHSTESNLPNVLEALQAAMDEENLFAVNKIIRVLNSLDVKDALVTQAEEYLEKEGHLEDPSLHRKHVIKFLAIARTAQDVQLLRDAVKSATKAGIAKWNVNLKSAESDLERLSDGEEAPIETRGRSSTEADTLRIVQSMLDVWQAEELEQLKSIESSIPSALMEFVDAKHERLKRVSELDEQLRQAAEISDMSFIETAMEDALGVGYCPPLLKSLFEKVDALLNIGEETLETESGLVAAVRFVSNRLQQKSEIRQDVLALIDNQTEVFFRTASFEGNSEVTSIVENAAEVRYRAEACLSAGSRLQQLCKLPLELLSVETLEPAMEEAKKANVHDEVLEAANEKLRGLSDDTPPFINGDFSTDIPEEDAETRARSDTAEWTDDDDQGEASPPKEIKSSRRQAATSFMKFERLRGLHSNSERTIAKKLQWEGRAITQSLTVLDCASSAQLALAINRCVLGYTRDRIVFYREMLAQYVLQVGLTRSSLVDEIYVQLMKQLTKNPKRDSNIRGWSLIALCASCFPPSEALQKHVILFLKAQVAESNGFWRLVKSYASYALKKLENLLADGASGFLPSTPEIRAYEMSPPFLGSIELLDGTPLAEGFPVSPEITAENMVEICADFLGLEDQVSKYLGLCVVSERAQFRSSRSSSIATPPTSRRSSVSVLTSGEDAPPTDSSFDQSSVSSPSAWSYFQKFRTGTFLSCHAHLGDVFEQEIIRGREAKFVLKVRLLPTYMVRYHEEMYDRLVYIQVLDEVVRGHLPLHDEDQVVRLSAIALGVDWGDEAPPLSMEDIVEMNILDYVPVEWHPLHDEEEWATLILDEMKDKLIAEDGELLAPEELQQMYVEDMSRHRLYGAVFFACKSFNRGKSSKKDAGVGACLGVDLPNYFVLAANGLGLHFLGSNGDILAFCDFADIAYYGGSSHQYKICLLKTSPNTTAREEITFATKYGNELTELLTDFKDLAALANEM